MSTLMAMIEEEAQRKPFLFIQCKTTSRTWLTNCTGSLLCFLHRTESPDNGNCLNPVLWYSAFYLLQFGSARAIGFNSTQTNLSLCRKSHIFQFTVGCLWAMFTRGFRWVIHHFQYCEWFKAITINKEEWTQPAV